MFVSHQTSDVEALPPIVMVFGGAAFGRLLVLADVMRVGPCDEISAPVKRGTESCLSPQTHTAERSCEDKTYYKALCNN